MLILPPPKEYDYANLVGGRGGKILIDQIGKIFSIFLKAREKVRYGHAQITFGMLILVRTRYLGIPP